MTTNHISRLHQICTFMAIASVNAHTRVYAFLMCRECHFSVPSSGTKRASSRISVVSIDYTALKCTHLTVVDILSAQVGGARSMDSHAYKDVPELFNH